MAKGYRFIGLLTAVVMMASCHETPEVRLETHVCAAMPSGRASACACAAEGKGYVFGGRDAKGTYQKDLWQYDPNTDKWTNAGKAPMNARVNATMVADGGTLYMGLGYSALRAYNDTAYQCDWWSFTPATGVWKRLADFPNPYTVAATSFAMDGRIYVLYGCGYSFSRQIGVYDIATDSWRIAEDNPARAKECFGGCGAIKEGVVYFGTGYDSHNLTQWYAADIARDEWTEKCAIPGKGRQWSACTAGKEHIYLFGGRCFAGDMTGGEILDTYMRYAPEKDAWEWCGAMPCGRAENMIAFAIDGNVYFGLGEDENGNVQGALYRIED